MAFPVTEHVAKTPRHTTFYLACGPSDAPPIIFVHGWPELSTSWRHQLPCFGALGFRAIAPDMRGYGNSSVHPRHEDYTLEHSVADMLELLQSLGHDKAVWVGHDWGSPVVWHLAGHHPERCAGLANLCVPYFARGFSPQELLPYVDRSVYPEATHPVGQWDYQYHYEEQFDAATRALEADVSATVRALFRKGNPAKMREPARLSTTRRDGGWFGGTGRAPDLPLDTDVLSEQDASHYTAALQRNGFFGPNSWYMNHARNREHAVRALNGGRLDMPVLFLHGQFDATCETVTSRLAEPMRKDCTKLSEATVPSGHWMAQEQPAAVNGAIARWLAREVPGHWPA
jgi:pimeloyl-ACP methyl ester carboxylesterase